MSERQKRFDEETAKAVTRGVNILAVRGCTVARRYMQHKHVPEQVIARVVTDPVRRRQPSAEHIISEAITPLMSAPKQE